MDLRTSAAQPRTIDHISFRAQTGIRSRCVQALSSSLTITEMTRIQTFIPFLTIPQTIRDEPLRTQTLVGTIGVPASMSAYVLVPQFTFVYVYAVASVWSQVVPTWASTGVGAIIIPAILGKLALVSVQETLIHICKLYYVKPYCFTQTLAISPPYLVTAPKMMMLTTQYYS